jgi:hypothetical protein
MPCLSGNRGEDIKTPADPFSSAASARSGSYFPTGCSVTPMMWYGLVP